MKVPTSFKLLHVAVGVLCARKFSHDLNHCIYAVSSRCGYVPPVPVPDEYWEPYKDCMPDLQRGLGISRDDAYRLFFNTAYKGRLVSMGTLIRMAYKYRGG